MKLHIRIAVLVGALAIAAVPAIATAAPSQTGQEHGQGSHNGAAKPENPGPKAALPEKAKAYGVYCKGESRKHVEGEKGTAFSRCVTAMAKAANQERKSAREACRGLSKKHVKGEKGTAFSRCVSAAAKVKADSQS